MFVIWGYDPATKACHGYGPYADQATADDDAAKARQIWPTWNVVVQPVEALSAKYPQADPAPWLLWTIPFQFVGATPVYHAYLSSDPAALDAYGGAMGVSMTYEIIQRQATV